MTSVTFRPECDVLQATPLQPRARLVRSQSTSRFGVREHLAAGSPVVAAHPELGGFIVVAAQNASTTSTAFLVRHTSGFVQIALPRHRCDELQLPPMNPYENGPVRMCVGVDAIEGTGTGISATDRATTARALSDPAAHSRDFTRPGHLVPVSVDDVDRGTAGWVPAAFALNIVRDAGLLPGALIADIVSVDCPTEMMNYEECQQFSRLNSLPIMDVSDS